MLFTAVLVTIISLTRGEFEDQFTDCDFSYNVTLGQTYNVSSPGYHEGSSYPPGTNCRWLVECPVDHNCQILCDDISLPKVPSCAMDRLLFDRYNESIIEHMGASFCGKGTLTTTSADRVMKIVLVTSSESPGGKFSCQLTAVPQSAMNCTCGYKKRIHTRIVDGNETEPNEFPMMAGLVDLNTTDQIFCGATIINQHYILTAAHCIDNKYVDRIAVVVGTHDMTKDEEFSKIYHLVGLLPHPEYNEENRDYDAALLMLSRKIHFSDQIGPACLPFKFKNQSMADVKVTAIGWGVISYKGDRSNVLRKVDLDVISQDSCRNRWSKLTDRQLCTIEPGKDACQGDSGGPLLYTDPSTGALFILGIISTGYNCAVKNYPAINTKVTEILDWIVESLNEYDEKYCRM